jgi:TolB-like protein/uncharacterized protein YlzI (FlbEa/FlbD family)
LAAAETWSGEIVQAIKDCKALIVLLSPHSVASVNVTKEVGLASEKRKTIIPITIADCQMSNAMEYALAGLHVVSIFDEEALSRTFEKFGITPGSPLSEPRSSAVPLKKKRYLPIIIPIGILAIIAGAYFLFISKKHESGIPNSKKTLAVLPFESLSADKENEYFADGMTATLIDMLVPIPELRVASRKTSMEFKSTKQDMKSVAAAIGARYLVDGTIQRQGNLIMINAQMTDAETGKVLLSKSFQGKTNDFLQLQQQIAKNIVVELQLAFNPDGIPFPSDATTSNPEAYNLCMKADFAEEHEENDSAISYFLQAAKLDTLYAFPYLCIARIYGNKYVNSGSPDSILSRMDSFFAIGKRLDTAQEYSHFVASWLATVHRDFDRAIKEATIYRGKRPEDARGYRVLGLAYAQSGRHSLASDNFIEDIKRNPMADQDMLMLLLNLWSSRDTVRLRQYAAQAITLFNASLARHPDDFSLSNNSIPLALVFTGRGDEACKIMDDLIKTPNIDSKYILNAAAINALSLKPARAMELVKMYIAKEGILTVDFERPFFDNIRSLPEFQSLVKEKEAKTKKNG